MSLARLLRSVELPPRTEVLDAAPSAPAFDTVETVLAAVRCPAALQAAQNALDRARDRHAVAAATLRELLARRSTTNAVDAVELAEAGVAEEAAKASLRAAKGELRHAIENWTPALRRLLAPHRADAAARITAAVDTILEAITVIGATDRFVEKWAIEPHPPLQMHDLRSLRFSAERIAGFEG